MSYEDTLIREMTDETPPNHEDACMVCDKIECVCPPEDACPTCGLEATKPDEDNKFGFCDLRYCPECEKEWLVERKQEPPRVRAPYEVRGSAASNACFGAL